MIHIFFYEICVESSKLSTKKVADVRLLNNISVICRMKVNVRLVDTLIASLNI